MPDNTTSTATGREVNMESRNTAAKTIAVGISITAFFKSLVTASNIRTHTHTRMPLNA